MLHYRMRFNQGRAPPARHNRPPQPALVEVARAPCGPCVCRRRRIAIAADGHALCRPRDATALHGRRWRRARAVRSTCVPPAAHCDCGGTTSAVPPARRDPPTPAGAGGGSIPSGDRVRILTAWDAQGARLAAHVCAAGCASRSLRYGHAKIMNGVLILQDMVAAFSFVIIEAFHRLKRSPCHSLYDATIAFLFVRQYKVSLAKLCRAV
jgi:hypothetical protein